MTCKTCGEKPKKCGNCNKDFPRAVIEIDNPESLVLLRKVIIPASLGDDTTIPASIGKYRNVLLHYDANGHNYLYSSDGIPTLLDVQIPQEIWDKIEELETDVDNIQQEIDDMKNNPDVVDIVDTYADLETYDTSKLSDNDIIRVLNDETHDDESSYYRWSKTAGTWTFIGATGPYYTKNQTDNLILGAKGAPRLLTSDDKNWNTSTQSATEPYNCIAVWLLPPGMYQKDANTGLARYSISINMQEDEIAVVGKQSTNGIPIFILDATEHSDGPGPHFWSFAKGMVTAANGNSTSEASWTFFKPVDNLTTATTDRPLAAKQGKILKDLIDSLVISGTGAPTTTTAGAVGQLYEDSTNGELYICTAVTPASDPDPAIYMWKVVGTPTFTNNEWNALWA